MLPGRPLKPNKTSHQILALASPPIVHHPYLNRGSGTLPATMRSSICLIKSKRIDLTASDGADQLLLVAAVADRLSCGVDTVRQS